MAITEKYTATIGKELGQPIQFEIIKYTIDVKNQFIHVLYNKHIFNATTLECQECKDSSYILKDQAQVLDEQGIEIQDESNDFTTWMNLSTDDKYSFDLNRILTNHGLENETPIT